MTIKEMRQATGLSQVKFAALLGMSRRNIEDWERDLKSPPPYVPMLIEYYLRHEGYIQDEKKGSE